MIASMAEENWRLPDVQQFHEHPEFKAAVELYKTKLLESYEGRYQRTKVDSGVVNFAIVGTLLGLHFSRDSKNPDSGATLSRLQDLATERGWCSRNKTAALLSLLDQWGLTTRTRSPQDRRVWRIEPTKKLLLSAKSDVMTTFTCLDRMFPEKGYMKALLDNRRFQEVYHSTRLTTFLNARYVCDQVPETKLYLNYSAGWQLLCKLMTSPRIESANGFNVVFFPFEEVGQIFGVSRFHVRRLISASEKNDLVVIRESGGKRIEITPRLVHAFERFIALRLGLVSLDADRALSRLYDNRP